MEELATCTTIAISDNSLYHAAPVDYHVNTLVLGKCNVKYRFSPLAKRPRNSFGFSTRRVCVAILAWVFAPAFAAGSCGDYVHFGPPGTSAMPAAHPTEKATPSNESPAPLKPVSPCQGPTCSQDRGPLLPSAPSVPSTPPNSVDAILFAASMNTEDDGSLIHLISVTRSLPLPTSIFHPPRA